MRRLAGSAVLFLSVGVATSAPEAPAGGSTTDVLEALSGIDFLPGVNQIGEDLTDLTDIANDVERDEGVRLRAYRSLGQFDNPEARSALELGIGRYRGAASGTELLFLIAAAEGLGQIAGPADVDVLGPLIDSSSRDLRVVVARALGHIGDANACILLRRRRGVEQTDQVQIAIDEATAVCP